MDYFSFAAGLLRQEHFFRTDGKGRQVLSKADELPPQGRHRLALLVYRKLGGERHPDDTGKLTVYFEQREGSCYIGLYHLEREEACSRLCFAPADSFEREVDFVDDCMLPLKPEEGNCK
ncbi:MAG: hypothetical protein HFJ85_05600 [Oscillospiraceae bacterium]|nr:hypothetical protein [Oscillospiraceae bacterium]